jgi:Leucine-rich repeat (LRR) protein
MNLPKTVLFQIYTFLNIRDAFSFALTCRSMLAIFELDYFWRSRTPQISNYSANAKCNYRANIFANELSVILNIKDIFEIKVIGIAHHKIDISQINILQNLTIFRCIYAEIKIAPQIEISSLKFLDLSNNYLQCIPPLCLLNLKKLQLNYNYLHELPQLNLPQLLELYISGNKFHIFPKIHGCPQLKFLIISSNYLRELPELYHIPNLCYLDVERNLLQKVPKYRYLHELRELYTDGNQLCDFDIGNPRTKIFGINTQIHGHK